MGKHWDLFFPDSGRKETFFFSFVPSSQLFYCLSQIFLTYPELLSSCGVKEDVKKKERRGERKEEMIVKQVGVSLGVRWGGYFTAAIPGM